MPDEFFSLFCHQLPTRSPRIGECCFPVCFRCAGIHLGIFLGCSYLLLIGRWKNPLPSLKVSLFLASLTFPVWLDACSNTLGIWDTPGGARYITGLLFGVAAPFLFIPVLQPIEISRNNALAASSLQSAIDLGLLLVIGLLFLWMLQSTWGFSLWSTLSFFVAMGIFCLATIALSCARQCWILFFSGLKNNLLLSRKQPTPSLEPEQRASNQSR
jgi:uncharacterized membrane protein